LYSFLESVSAPNY